MTYNILSEKYCRDDLYGYCPIEYLAVDYRKQLLIKEIMGYHADIICLQEVDASVLKHFYSKSFKKDNYIYMFNTKGNKSTEGLLLAYRLKKFTYVYYIKILIFPNFNL